MARKRKKSPEQAERDRVDARMQRMYCLSLAEYEQQLERQGGVCAICKKLPGPRRLAVEHCHRTCREKPKSYKIGPKQWAAKLDSRPGLQFNGATKPQVLAAVRAYLKRQSIRGLCCSRCNRGLSWWRDQSVHLRSAADYLDRFYKGTI